MLHQQIYDPPIPPVASGHSTETNPVNERKTSPVQPERQSFYISSPEAEAHLKAIDKPEEPDCQQIIIARLYLRDSEADSGLFYYL